MFFVRFGSYYIIYYYLCIQNLTIQYKKIRIIQNLLSDVIGTLLNSGLKIGNR